MPLTVIIYSVLFLPHFGKFLFACVEGFRPGENDLIKTLKYRNPTRTVSDVVGTTAEIYEYAQSENGFIIKAKGRQRFKVLKVTSELIKYSDLRLTFGSQDSRKLSFLIFQ